jgi:glycosyltransferase involved in cell wall biosynthesis
MKIRIYTPFFPLPCTEGAFQIIADQIQSFYRCGHWVEVVVILDSVWNAQKKLRSILDKDQDPYLYALLSPSSGSVCFRFLQESLQNTAIEAYTLETLLSKPLAQAPHLNRLSRLRRVASSLFSRFASPEIYYYPLEPLADLGRRLSETVDWAIYHYSFSYAWLAQAAKQNSPSPITRHEIKKAVFFHNLESDLATLRASSTQLPIPRWIHQLNAKKLKSHELALAKITNELWFISPKDQIQYLERLNPSAASPVPIIRLTPPTYPSSLREKRTQGFQKFCKANPNHPVVLGFIGGMDFQPNSDSAQWILNELAPELTKNGFKGKILIVGKNPSSQLLEEAKAFSFVEILGFVEKIETFWEQISLMLVPHISGSGVRMKLLEALASGIPVLANRQAIERIHTDLQSSPLIHPCESLENWVGIILKEKPFFSRKLAQTVPTSKPLEGQAVYSFLRGS